jgi:hypothetical protein
MDSKKWPDKRSGSGSVHAMDDNGDIVRIALHRKCVFSVAAMQTLSAEGYVWQIFLDADGKRFSVGKYKSLGSASQACVQLNSDAHASGTVGADATVGSIKTSR